MKVKVFRSFSRSVHAVSREDWACLVLVILGVILFLVGANIYNSIVGWLGVFLFVSGVLAVIVLYVYHALTKPKDQPEPQNA